MASAFDDSLARVLLAKGRATQAAIDEAQAVLRRRGGSLDSALLEAGAVDARSLTESLEKAWRTAPVAAAVLAEPHAEATALLPEAWALEHGIAPLFVDGDGLHVACVTPLDRAALENLGGRLGTAIVPHAALEVRVHQARVRAYGIPMEERLSLLLVDDEPAPVKPAMRANVQRAWPPPSMIPTAAEGALDGRSGESEDDHDEGPDLTQGPTTLAEALAALDAQNDRDGVVGVAVRYARRFLPFAAFIGTKQGHVHGWLRAGPHERSTFDQKPFAIPTDSALAFALRAPSPSLGKPALTVGNDALLGWLGRRRPRSLLILPVFVGTRALGAVVGDTGLRIADTTALADLVAFGARLGAAFERLLSARKNATAKAAATAEAPEPVLAPARAIPDPRAAAQAAVQAAENADDDNEWDDVSMEGTHDLVEPKPLPASTSIAVPTHFAAEDAAQSAAGLVDDLFSDDVAIIAEAKIRLLEMGKGAVAALSERFPGPLLQDPLLIAPESFAPSKVGPVVDVVAQLGAVGLDAAMAHLDDDDARTRALGALLFFHTVDSRAIEALYQRLSDSEPRVQMLAAFALSPFVAHPDFEMVLQHLRERVLTGTPDGRRGATQVLAQFRDVGAVPLLLQLLERPENVRDAWVALREITLQDFGPRPRPWDKWWQKAKRKSRIDWLIDGLESDDVELRKLSVAELAPIAGDDFNYDAEFEKRMRQNSIKMFRKWWSDQAWRES